MKKLSFNPQAIIFDMDGVIVDSMPYHFIAWYEALRPFGVRVSCFDVYAREGEKWDTSMRDFLTAAGVQPTDDLLHRIFESRKKIFRRYFRRHIFKGATEFIECLANKGYTLALVTGTTRKGVMKILPGSIRKHFSVVVCGDDVKQGKPHPEPYLRAAKDLGVEPKKCVVIENAPYGIASAKKAGMFCVAVTTSLPKEYLKKADTAVNELSDIMGIINTCPIPKRGLK